MKIGKTTGWLISLSASAFLHVAVLSVAKLIVPRGRTPATEISKERIRPVELISLGPEPKPPIVMPQITPVQISIPEVNPPEIVQTKPEPAKPEAERPLAPVRRRSGSRPVSAALVPSPSESAEEPPAAPAPVPPPLSEPQTIEHTTWVTVNGQRFPIRVTAPGPDSRVTMPVEYFLQYPGGLATEPASQAVIRDVAAESMASAERAPGPPVTAVTAPAEEGVEPVARPGELDPTPVLIPRWRETEDGFIFSLHDPAATNEGYTEREYRFRRQENDDLVCTIDAHNRIIIHPDGSFEDTFNYFPRPQDVGLLYSVLDIFNLELDPPHTSHTMYREVEEATGPFRRQREEQYDNSVTREALDNLYAELLRIIKSHEDWSLAEQHDFLFRRWDECREDSVGNEARTTIEEFIRRHYPQGTPREITKEELRSFNERRQTESQSFSPYPD